MKARLASLSCIIVVFFLTSCQKPASDPDPIDPIPSVPPVSAVDSTLLIKSLRYTIFEEDGTTINSSETQLFSYDTVNRKISFSYEEDGAPVNYMPKVEFSYNESHQLIRADYAYLPTYTPTEEDYQQIDFEYDAEKIISKFTVKYGDGHIRAVPIIKRKLAGNITELEREEDYFDQYPTNNLRYKVRTALDQSHRRLYEISDQYSYGIYSGAFKHLISYTPEGNVSKFTYEHTNENNEIDSSLVVVEFTSFSQKANQLYTLQKLLFNGVDDITQGDAFFQFGGALSQFIGSTDQGQFYNHLFTTGSSNTELGGHQAIQSSAEHDSRGRLTKFKCFFFDIIPFPAEWNITYYKN